MASSSPKLYVLKYEFADNSSDKRAQNLDAHKAGLKKQVEAGNVVLAGAVDHPAKGTLTIFRNITPADIEKFVAQDPYYTNGLVSRYTIRPYFALAGDPALKNDFSKS